jgi:hypothetical protein
LNFKRILSLFLTIALLAGLFVTPAFADQNSWQNNLPSLQQYLNILEGQAYTPSITLPDGSTAWAHFDRGQIVYGFPWDVTSSNQKWKQAPGYQFGDNWDTANALDYRQAPSVNAAWSSGLQFTPSYSGQEPRYLGYIRNSSGGNPIEVSNESFPIDSSGMTPPALCGIIQYPWTNVSIDPNYQNECSSGWPKWPDTSAIPDSTWGVIKGAITDCWKNDYSETDPDDSFIYNSAFSGGINPTNIEQYFELLSLPEPGNAGEVRFWHKNPDGTGPYYKDIAIPWQVLPQYVTTNLTPFSGLQTSSTQTVDSQIAAVYNTNGAQYQYTGTVTYSLQPDLTYTGITRQLAQLMNLTMLTQKTTYYAPFAVCVNSQNNYATIDLSKSDPKCYPVTANENAGGTNQGILLGSAENGGISPGTYTVTFTWSIPQGFSGTEMPIGAGIDDGSNDYLHQAQADIIPNDISFYGDPYEQDHMKNYSVQNVPVVDATQPQLIVTPASFTINVGDPPEQYTATYYPNGQSQGNGQEVTMQSTWSGDNNSVATIETNTGLATGVSAGSTNISASYMPPDGSAMTGTANLKVQAQQQLPGGQVSGVLRFTAVGQAGSSRPAGTAKWTDTVTAKLTSDAPPQPTATGRDYITGWTWSISNVILNYPTKNPNFTFGYPVDPVVGATTPQSMVTHGSSLAAASFRENWSMDGAGNGRGIYSIIKIPPGIMATDPIPFKITAAWTVQSNWTLMVFEGYDQNGNPKYSAEPESQKYTGACDGALTVNGSGVNSLGNNDNGN